MQKLLDIEMGIIDERNNPPPYKSNLEPQETHGTYGRIFPIWAQKVTKRLLRIQKAMHAKIPMESPPKRFGFMQLGTPHRHGRGLIHPVNIFVLSIHVTYMLQTCHSGQIHSHPIPGHRPISGREPHRQWEYLLLNHSYSIRPCPRRGRAVCM